MCRGVGGVGGGEVGCGGGVGGLGVWGGGGAGGVMIGDGISSQGASCLRAPYGSTTSPSHHLWLCVLRMNPCYSAIVTVA